MNPENICFVVPCQFWLKMESGWFAVGFLMGKVEADRRLRRRASVTAVA